MSDRRGRSGKEFWLAALRHEGAAFRAAVSAERLDDAVPSCPEWTVGELVAHLGRVCHWVADHVARGVTIPPEPHEHLLPPAGDELSWWDEAFGRALATLDGLDPGYPAWNAAPQPKQAAYWHRRLAHETAIHRWDAQVAAGTTEPIESNLAADGVAEVLDTRLPAGFRSDPGDVAGMVRLVAPDVDEEWFARLRGDAVALLDTDTLTREDHPVDAQMIGSASDLDLALWGRIPFDVLEVSGDPRLLDAIRTR